MNVEKYNGRTLSKFKTHHIANFYVEIKSEADIPEAFALAKQACKDVFVLGAGSNVFFKNKKIKSAVLKNSLPQEIKHIDGDLFEVSAGVEMMKFLNFAFKDSRDCCYYLASAPCQVGGAIAMNAGSGPKEAKSISDFIESVRFFDGEKIVEKQKDEIAFSYRHSDFIDKKCFIISAKFRLPKIEISGNPIRDRLAWATEKQDLATNNCGSMCNRYYAPILKFTRFVFAKAPAGLSKKSLNWAVNNAENPRWLRVVFGTIKLLHKILCKPLKFEIRMID